MGTIEVKSFLGLTVYIRGIKTIDNEKINKLDLSNCEFFMELRLKDLYMFLKYIKANEIYNGVNFSNCIFRERVWLEDLGDYSFVFDNSIFYQEFELKQLTIDRELSFQYVHFYNNVSFSNLIFWENNKIDVGGSVFNRIVRFTFFDPSKLDLNYRGRMKFNNVCILENIALDTLVGKIKFSNATLFLKDLTCSTPLKLKNEIGIKKIILNRVEFKEELRGVNLSFGKIYLHQSIFHNKVSLRYCDFKDKIEVYNTSFDEELDLLGCEFSKSLLFKNSLFKSINFDKIVSKSLLSMSKILVSHWGSFINATVYKLNIINSHFDKSPLLTTGLKVNLINRETARFLKHEAYDLKDIVAVLEFQKREMRAYLGELHGYRTWCSQLLLILNWSSNNYGVSWLRGVGFTLLCWFIFFSLFIIARDGWGDCFIWFDSDYLLEAVSYLWLLDGLRELSGNDGINWGMMITFILGKVLIGYGIYQTISAFRKFGK